MVAFLIQLLLAIRSWFARRARLESETTAILTMRHMAFILRSAMSAGSRSRAGPSSTGAHYATR
jgi:hypothetical protein